MIKVGQCFNTFFIILGLLAKGVCSELIATLTIVDYRMVVQNNGSLISNCSGGRKCLAGVILASLDFAQRLTFPSLRAVCSCLL